MKKLFSVDWWRWEMYRHVAQFVHSPSAANQSKLMSLISEFREQSEQRAAPRDSDDHEYHANKHRRKQNTTKDHALVRDFVDQLRQMLADAALQFCYADRGLVLHEALETFLFDFLGHGIGQGIGGRALDW